MSTIHGDVMSGRDAADEIKVVVVVYYHDDERDGPVEGEFKHWIDRYGLSQRISFPQGDHDLRMREDGVLGIAAGIGVNTATATIMGLGMDPRFDLSRAYWLIAGVGGADPAMMTVGSLAFARYVVDADKKHMLDPREMPEDWRFGTTPFGVTTEEFPVPVQDTYRSVFRLNDGLAKWARQTTKDVDLARFVTPDDVAHCARFKQDDATQRPPQVILGDILAGDNFWHGRMMNDWARAWVDYWTEGKGRFAISCCEDCGTLTALSLLDRMGNVDFSRVTASRTASNFTCQWDGATAGESLATEDVVELSGLNTALESAYAVGSHIVDELVLNWDQYRTQTPSL
jgi:purine nucleoside permease